MPIVFEPLVAFDTGSSADGSIFLLGEANMFPGGASGVPIAYGTVFYFGGASGLLHTTAAVEESALVDGGVGFGAIASMAEGTALNADGTIAMRGLGFTGSGAFCEGGYECGVTALESLDILSGDIAMPITYFPWMYGLAGGTFEIVRDGLAAGSEVRGHPRNAVLENIAAAGASLANLDGRAQLRDGLIALGVEAPVVIIVQRESLALADLAIGDYAAIERVIESLLLEGHANSVMEAVSKTADVLAAIAIAEYLMLADTSDVLAMTSAAEYAFQAIERVLDSGVLFSAERQMLSIVTRDELVTSDAPKSAAEIFALLRDGLGLIGHFRLDDGEYTAWVVNTESSGITTYDNFPFNSFATIGGVQFGMSTFGCFTLDADDDDGEDIAARLRVGMTDMGTRVLKTVTEAYIGFASPDKMILRTITPNPTTGALEAYDYYMKATANATVAPQRFEPGRGLKAVDWDFELENTNGAELELHSVELLPVKLSRRVRN